MALLGDLGSLPLSEAPERLRSVGPRGVRLSWYDWQSARLAQSPRIEGGRAISQSLSSVPLLTGPSWALWRGPVRPMASLFRL